MTRAQRRDNDSISATGWRTASADAFGWLIDGENYFGALRDALDRAEREILIVGWDIDSEVELIRDPDHPQYPSPLCDTLCALLDARPDLHINVLSWDFAAIYVLERELFPAMAFGWRTSDRLHFHLDGRHATGASHHQKVVVIDGALAFVGGFDLTKCRWDSRAHRPDDDRRIDTSGSAYRPFHDVQAVMTGEAAAAMRELGAGRWRNATGRRLPELEPGDGAALWPERAVKRASDVDVVIARTWVEPDGNRVIREVEDSYCALIDAARDWIYLENQYFTSARIVEALEACLRRSDGPEVVVVLPFETAGWLEQATMEMRRNHAIAQLRDADAHGRLRVVGPVRDDLEGETINVHSKVAVVDGRWLRIGSANLSARSMGLDSECDLIVEAPDAALALAADLLGEHLGADAGTVRERIASDGLLATLDAHGGGGRRVDEIHATPGEFDTLLEPIASIADMEQPITRTLPVGGADPDDAAAETEAPAPSRGFPTPTAGWWFLAAIVVIGAGWLYAAWHGDDASVDLKTVLDNLRAIASHPAAPFAMVGIIVAGSLVVAPITGLIALCGVLFGPWVASATALTGTLIATVLIHWIGERFGPTLMRRVPDAIVDKLRRMGEASDALSLAALRLIPIAPFSIINLAAGAAGVRRGPMLLGTVIGMGPGTVLICLSVDRARAALAGEAVFDPTIIAVIGGAAVLFIALRIWMGRRRSG